MTDKTKTKLGLMKIFVVTVGITAAMLYMSALCVWADDSGSCGDDASWTLEGDALTITGTGEIYYGGWDRESVCRVEIFSGIDVIGAETFQSNYNIQSVDFPNSLREIGDFAFNECTRLTEIDLSNTQINELGEYVFSECRSLNNVSLPTFLEIIGEGAFKACYNLESISIPNVYEISNYAFDGCASLKTLDISNVKVVNKYTFYNCTALEKVYCSASSGERISYFSDYSPNVCLVYNDFSAVQNTEGMYFISGFSLDFGDSVENYAYAGLYYSDETEPVDTSDTVYTGFTLGDTEFDASEMGYDYIIGYKARDDVSGYVSSGELYNFLYYTLKPVAIADSEA